MMRPLTCQAVRPRGSAPEDEDHDTWLPSCHAFVAMLEIYRSSGGMLRAENLSRLLKTHGAEGASNLTGLLASRAVYGFHWQESMWVPMFQFDPRNLSVNRLPSQVREALGPDFEDWSLASWFARRNPKLGNQRPVELLESDFSELMQAAREDGTVGLEASAGRHFLPAVSQCST